MQGGGGEAEDGAGVGAEEPVGTLGGRLLTIRADALVAGLACLVSRREASWEPPR